MPAAPLLGRLALGIGLLFFVQSGSSTQHDRRALDRVSLESGQHAAQLVGFDHIVVEQQLDLAQRIWLHLAFVRPFELELTC